MIALPQKAADYPNLSVAPRMDNLLKFIAQSGGTDTMHFGPGAAISNTTCSVLSGIARCHLSYLDAFRGSTPKDNALLHAIRCDTQGAAGLYLNLNGKLANESILLRHEMVEFALLVHQEKVDVNKMQPRQRLEANVFGIFFISELFSSLGGVRGK